MGSSASLDRYSRSPPRATANAAWEKIRKPEEEKARPLADNKNQSSLNRNPRPATQRLENLVKQPATECLDNLIKRQEMQPDKYFEDGLTRERFPETPDSYFPKHRPSPPRNQGQNLVPTQRTYSLQVAQGRIQSLTNRVEELETQQKSTAIRMESIWKKGKTLEMNLEAALLQIETLTQELEKAKNRNGEHSERRAQVEESFGSEMLSKEMNVQSKRKRSGEADENGKRNKK